MNIIIDEGAKMPERAHAEDAGLDLFSREDKIVPSHGSAIFDTGAHIELESGTVGFLKSKSGLNVKHDITSEGVIDSGFGGSIVVKLYNHGNEPYHVKEGDKITQLVVVPILTPKLKEVMSFAESERGENGFGSTGR